MAGLHLSTVEDYPSEVPRPEESPIGPSARGLPGAAVYGGEWPGGARVRLVSFEGGAEELWRLFRDAIQESADLRAVSHFGGSALGLAAFVAAHRSLVGKRHLPEPAFAISVGEAVRRGLPTASRATISGRAPLRRGLVEAPFGGQFARAFAASTDLLLVFGQGRDRRAVISLDRQGEVLLGPAPFGEDASAPARAAALPKGQHALLVGPAAESGLPFANLGSWSAPQPGGEHLAPSLVGRGGLGTTVCSAGVVAITVASAPDQAAEPTSGAALRSVLEASPRLIARAKGGTLELGDVRGVDPTSPGGSAPDAGTLRAKKHGCEGCPTPCGWQFQLPTTRERAGVGGRFAALQGFLGTGDPAESMGRAMAALQACNELGMDARSAALLVGEHVAARGASDGESAADLVAEFLKAGSPLRQRALAMGPGADVEPAEALMPGDLAGRVGVALAARGPEPLRSLSVLGLTASGASQEEEQERLARDLRLVGLGRDEDFNAGVIAHWQECFSAALDLTGFCAFSGSALIADGLLTLDQLSEALSLEMHGPKWLGVGGALIALHVELNDHRAATPPSLPAAAVRGYVETRHRGWESAPVSLPGQTKSGRVSGAAVLADGSPITVRASGALALRLTSYPGASFVRDEAVGQRFLRLEVSATDETGSAHSVGSALGEIARLVPRARPWLLRADGAPLPAVLIAGRAVPGGRPVGPGDDLELLLVIPGG